MYAIRCAAGFLALAAIPFSTTSPCAASEPASRFLNCGGVKIHFVEQGTGEPVVLIHGLYSSVDINWRATGILNALSKDHRVIALDLPGHGRSDRPANNGSYGVQIVEDVVALLDHLKIERAHVVGYSIGGMVAVKLIVLHPDRVRSGTVGGMGWFRAGSALQKFWDRLPGRERARVPPAFLRSVGQLAVSADELKKIDLPVEILIGDRDPVKRLYVDPLRSVRKDWPVVEIRDAGHINCILKTQFRDEIGAWLLKNAKP